MARPTEQIKVFARQMSRRACRIEDHALANTMLSLGAALEWMAIAMRDVYAEVHNVNKKLDRHIKSQKRRP